jgi:hypothetical protein
MRHIYEITNFQKGSELKLTEVLTGLEEVRRVKVDAQQRSVTIEMESHIDQAQFNHSLQKAERSESLTNERMLEDKPSSEVSTWKKYQPLGVILLYVLGGSVLLGWLQEASWMSGLRFFMGLFFIFFSLFKFLDLSGFADGYATYDMLAKRWSGWGLGYPFIELALGIAFLVGWQMVWLNWLTLGLMLFGALGVAKELLAGRKIQCACLGTVLKVPLTKVTLVEDLGMAAMAGLMLVAS